MYPIQNIPWCNILVNNKNKVVFGMNMTLFNLVKLKLNNLLKKSLVIMKIISHAFVVVC